jgi:hypothetical protein
MTTYGSTNGKPRTTRPFAFSTSYGLAQERSRLLASRKLFTIAAIDMRGMIEDLGLDRVMRLVSDIIAAPGENVVLGLLEEAVLARAEAHQI